MLLIVFLAGADYSALAAHPARIVVAVVLVALAVISLVSGVRLLRSGSRAT
jgi:hypothetical protein